MDNLAQRQAMRRGDGWFVRHGKLLAEREKQDDLERLREAILDYEESPTCVIFRETMRLLKNHCLKHYPDDTERVCREATHEAALLKIIALNGYPSH